MNCFRVQSMLSAYIDQELNAEDRRFVRTHLFNCPECSREFDSLTSLKNILGCLPAPEISGNSLLLVHQELYSIHKDYRSNSHYLNGHHLMMTAACISLFLATSFMLFPKQMQDGTNLHAASKTVSPPILASREQIEASQFKTKPKTTNQPLLEPFHRIESGQILSGITVSR